MVMLPELTLESGIVLKDVEIAYERAGINETPVILLCHALTGNQEAVGTEENPGWWQGLVGPNGFIDTEKFQVITFNILGGCSGSTGPASINPQTGRPYKSHFPNITVRDVVNSQFLALRQLGITEVDAVIGGSLGGMQVYEWGVLYPNFMSTLIVLAATPYLSDYAIAYNAVARQAIVTDPGWNNGSYEDGAIIKGLQVARMIGMITYRTAKMFNSRFQRRINNQNVYQIQSYLTYQGEKLSQRFDANSYLCLLGMMDQHDIGWQRNGWKNAIKSIKAKVVVFGFKGDLLYPSDQIRIVTEELVNQGKEADFHEISTEFGHDGFLVEYEKWGLKIKSVIEEKKMKGSGHMSVIKVAILGFGTVGEGVYRTIQSHQEELRAILGRKVEVVAVLIKNNEKERAIDSRVLITKDFEDIIGLPNIDVVFEAIVEKEPSFTYLKRALIKGCHIITANKEMFSQHGRELIELAAQQKVSVGFEATVAGGVPIIQTLQQLLKVNNVSAIQGILNGTSNFILTEMRERKQSFIESLKLAQQKGYAEADPGNDINGCDAYFKLMVLSGIAFGEQPELRCVKINGITAITTEQIELADKLGLRFKHIASIERKEDRLHASVIPTLVSKSHPFYHVEGVENAVNVKTDLVGSITLQGPGAGMFPTASAMVEDLVQVLQSPATVVNSWKQNTVVKTDEKAPSTSYWLVSNLNNWQSLSSISYSDPLSEGVYSIKASKEQLVKLFEQNVGLITYPILGTFELESEREEARLIGSR